jgi:hypothetical protein
MSGTQIKAILCIVGEAPVVLDVPNTLDHWQELVGGYVQQVHLDDGVHLLSNEDGLAQDLPFNGKVPGRAPRSPMEHVAFIVGPTNRPEPGQMGVHRLCGNFALVRVGLARDYESVTDVDVARWLPALIARMAT